MSHKEIEEGTELNLILPNLKKSGAVREDIIPAVAQDHQTGEVLIVGYVNAFALETAQAEGMATFSTSRNELWIEERHLEISLKS